MYNMRSLVTVIRAVFCIGALLLISATVHAQECLPAPEGMVGWWPGDGNADDIENGNNGSVTGTTFSTGQVGLGFSFDGDDHVTVPPSGILDITGDVTVDCWAQRSSFGGTQILIDRGGGFVGGVDVATAYGLLFAGDDTIRGVFEKTDTTNGTIIGPAITDLDFHHYAYVRSGSTHQIYVDGQLKASAGFSGTVASASTVPLSIGARPDDSGNLLWFAGQIDEVEIYNRALLAGEIQAIFDAGSAGKCKDEDGDGFRPLADCDETNAAINPNAVELPGNFVDENCDGSLGDVDPCADWQNHGKYVRAVAHAVNDLVGAGLITEEEGDALVSSAAMSKIGKSGFVPPECP